VVGVELASWAEATVCMTDWSDLAYEAEHAAREGDAAEAWRCAVNSKTALEWASLLALLWLLED
jgi:hypothetical protein